MRRRREVEVDDVVADEVPRDVEQEERQDRREQRVAPLPHGAHGDLAALDVVETPEVRQFAPDREEHPDVGGEEGEDRDR